MFKTVVVPFEHQGVPDRALVPGRALASRADADLVVVMERTAVGTAELPADAAVQVSAEPDLSDAIATAVADHPDPVVVMTSHPWPGLARVVSGGFAESLVRWIPAPFVLVGPAVDVARAIHYDQLLVCTDGSPAADAIAPVAGEWVHGLGLRPQVVEVIDRDTVVPEELGRDVLESTAAHALAARLGPRAQWEVLHDRVAADAIVDYARRLPASLIAMSTHGRTGLARVAMGSTTAAVVQHAPCPVLVVGSFDVPESGRP